MAHVPPTLETYGCAIGVVVVVVGVCADEGDAVCVAIDVLDAGTDIAVPSIRVEPVASSDVDVVGEEVEVGGIEVVVAPEVSVAASGGGDGESEKRSRSVVGVDGVAIGMAGLVAPESGARTIWIEMSPSAVVTTPPMIVAIKWLLLQCVEPTGFKCPLLPHATSKRPETSHH